MSHPHDDLWEGLNFDFYMPSDEELAVLVKHWGVSVTYDDEVEYFHQFIGRNGHLWPKVLDWLIRSYRRDGVMLSERSEGDQISLVTELMVICYDDPGSEGAST